MYPAQQPRHEEERTKTLGGDVRPLALSPLFINQIEGDIKQPTLLFEKGSGPFYQWCGLPRIHHSYHGLGG